MLRGIHQGDCREVMASLPAASVDSIVTDPPYGLDFMGREWDHGVPGVPFWTEALRVLKPGGHMVAFGGTRTYHRLTCAIEDAGFEVRDCLMWLYGSGFPKSLDVSKAIDKTRREWSGWGTALKPAWEPIILARKPLIGNVATNVQEHGTGALNIDGCRVDAESGGRPAILRRNDKSLDGDVYGSGINGSKAIGLTAKGRWPANLVLDEEAGAMLDEQTGELTSGARSKTVIRGSEKARGIYNKGWDGDGTTAYPDDVPASSGGASRFFYCAKASKKDRGEGNTHPTVKPNALMRWLVRLVTPPGGIVLDPFMGSGSTGVAAKAEGFQFIGLELDPAYIEIARKRCGEA
jgi:site-specific DNA-methyltransferase (adenine-specific)